MKIGDMVTIRSDITQEEWKQCGLHSISETLRGQCVEVTDIMIPRESRDRIRIRPPAYASIWIYADMVVEGSNVMNMEDTRAYLESVASGGS